MTKQPKGSTARGTSKLPASAFAYPSRRAYPINTQARARAALSRAASSRTGGTYEHVARAVRARYGSAITSTSPRRGVVYRPGPAKRSR